MVGSGQVLPSFLTVPFSFLVNYGVFKTCLRIIISFYKKLLASDILIFIPAKMSDDEISVEDSWMKDLYVLNFCFLEMDSTKQLIETFMKDNT